MAKLTSHNVGPSSGPIRDDNALDDLRTKYALALSKHNSARARLAEISSTDIVQVENSSIALSSKNPGITTSRQRQLEDYLENLRLQRRHRSLQLLSHHSKEAEKIASEENIFDGFESTARTTTHTKDSDQQVALIATQRHLETLIDGAKARTTNLELAVVKARQQLKLEQSLLERVKGHPKEWRNGEATGKAAFAHQRAMEVTRDELQRWISEGLVRCEQEMAPPPGAEVPDIPANNLEPFDEDNDPLVETEYERYLEVRSQLVHVANILRTPLPEPEIEASSTPISKPLVEQKVMPDDQKQKLALQRAPHLRHKSRISIVKLGEQSGGPDLAKIESTHLPRYHHERLLNTHATHLNVQTTAQDSRLLQNLGLLSHESHLLPSFPLSAVDSAQGKSSIKPSQHQAEIDYLLRSWTFASDTADEVLRENVERNAEETKEALERARQHLDEVRIVEDMSKEVTTSHKLVPGDHSSH